VLIVVLFGCATCGRTTGILSGLVLAASVSVCHYAQLGYADTTLMLTCAGMCCSAAWLVSAPRPGLLPAVALGLSLGLGILTKGHIPLLLLLAPLATEVILRRSFDGRKVLLFLLALAIAAAVAVPWFAAVEHRHPGAWSAMGDEIGDALESTGHRQSTGAFFYLYKLAGGLLPWTPLVLIGWALSLKWKRLLAPSGTRSALSRPCLRFLLLFLGLGLLGFLLVLKKQEHYLLPLFPALALLSGSLLGRFRTPGGIAEEAFAWSQLVIGLALALAIASIPLWPAAVSGLTGRESPFALGLAGFMGTAVIPLALAFACVQFYCARQWVEGRAVAAGLGVAVLLFAGWTVWSVHWVRETRRAVVINTEAPRLREDLDKLGKNVQLYSGGGLPEPVAIFYLARHVASLRDLAQEPTGRTGTDSPQRILLGTRAYLTRARAEYQISSGTYIFGEDHPILAFALSRDVDWPARVTAAIQAKAK
jgi:4-amino-4-deoxy-L-arabinose transferase-like glycosyltransferase